MAGLHTKPELLEALQRAAAKPLTTKELRDQRVSFIMAFLKDDSGVTRAQVSRALESRDGIKEMDAAFLTRPQQIAMDKALRRSIKLAKPS